jgi:2',3'-cyclic-nucleotide 2'-phosphodiesterase (5'-nucleotidase family)
MLRKRTLTALLATLICAMQATPTRAQPSQPTSQAQPASRPTPTTTPVAATTPLTAKAAKANTRGERRVHVLFSSDIYGRYDWPGCRKRKTGKTSLAHLIGAARKLRGQIAAAGDPAPLLVHAGSLLRPDIMGNFIFRDAPKLAPLAGKLLARVGFDGVAVGLFDFGASPAAFARYRKILSGEGIPLLASNVNCTADSRCEGLYDKSGKRYRILERGGLRIGLFAVLRGDLSKRIIRRGKGQLKAEDPVSFSRALVRKLRQKEKVDVVIGLANLNLENTAPRPVLDYVRALGADAPELVVANAMYERGSDAGYLHQIRRGKTLIVGTDRFGQHLGQAVLTLKRGADQRWTVATAQSKQHTVARFAADAQAKAPLKRFLRAMCAEVDQPIGKGVFKRPISYAGFLDYMMQIMRKRTASEVAAINDSGIADTSFPMKGRLTWEKILRAIRTETKVGYVQITGARLKSLLGKHAQSSGYGLRVLGLAKKGTSWRVNGRPLIKGHTYRVATTQFVAGNGDDLVTFRPKTEGFKSLGVTLRDLATDFFGADGEADYDSKLNINVKKDFPDLHRRWLLYGDLKLGFALSTVTVSNGASNSRYSLPLLRRDDLVTITGTVEASLGASTRDHVMELDVSLNYGKTFTTVKVEDPDGSGQFRDDTVDAESLDRITTTFIYKLRALRNAYGNKWYIPEPYSEVRLITEFTDSGACSEADCPDPDDQTYRYMDLGGTLGLGLTLHPLFFVKLGAVMRGELLTPSKANPDILARPGIYLGYLLRRWKIIADTHHPLELESRLDFYFTDFGGQLRRELTLDSKAYFSLTRRLALTLGHRLYFFDKRCKSDDLACNAQGDDASIANDILFGLSVRLDFRLQTF